MVAAAMCACDEGGEVGVSPSEFESCCNNNWDLLYLSMDYGVSWPEGFACQEWYLQFFDFDQNGLIDETEVINIVAQMMEAVDTSKGDLFAYLHVRMLPCRMLAC